MPVSEELVNKTVTALLADPPDPTALLPLYEREHGGVGDAARDALRSVVAKVNARLFPPVTKLELIHTEGCNLACSYCFEKEMLGYRRMSLETIIAGLELLFEYSREQKHLRILHFGGEPTVNFSAVRSSTEYAERRAAALGKQMEFHMTSNGVLLNEVMVDYFAEHKIRVLLSLDGLTETHDRHRLDRRGRGSFERALRGLRLLKTRQHWVGVKMTVMPEAVPDLLRDVVGLHELGANQFLIGHATGIPWTDAQIDAYGREFGRVYEWYRKNRGENLLIAEIDDQDGGGEPAYFGCQAGRNSITIAVNGEISPCSKILGLNNKQLLAKLGDVRFGITHLKNRLELNSCNKLRQACDVAKVASEYQGGCFASNFSAHGDLYQPNLDDHRFTLVQRAACSGCSSRTAR